MSETWRIVLADGTVVPVVVSEDPGLGDWWRARVEGYDVHHGLGETSGAAVTGCAGGMFYNAREIVPPGELTRAEAIAAARAEGVAEGMERAAVICEDVQLVEISESEKRRAVAGEGTWVDRPLERSDGARYCAAAIRAAAKGGV
jgi:hypothetical protein